MDPTRRVHAAYRDERYVVLEGLHALKHALRFGAAVEVAFTPDPAIPAALAARLAPDIAATLRDLLTQIPAQAFGRLAPKPPASGVLAIARRPIFDLDEVLQRPGPIVVLERPTHPGNVGAVIRVAAAAGAAAVLTSGDLDPWSAPVLRGSAGLHFALPVCRVADLPSSHRPVVALHPEGQPLDSLTSSGDPLLLFGSERTGLSTAWLARAQCRLAIPMRPGVSSLNLATSVAVALYAGKWAHAC